MKLQVQNIWLPLSFHRIIFKSNAVHGCPIPVRCRRWFCISIEYYALFYLVYLFVGRLALNAADLDTLDCTWRCNTFTTNIESGALSSQWRLLCYRIWVWCLTQCCCKDGEYESSWSCEYSRSEEVSVLFWPFSCSEGELFTRQWLLVYFKLFFPSFSSNKTLS